MRHVEVAQQCGNTLGEGPLWDSREGRLLWVDGFGKKYATLDPANGRMEEYPTGEFTIALALREGGGLLVATDDAVYTTDKIGGTFERLLLGEFDTDALRFNDGTAAPDGGCFLGTLHREDTEPRAGLYRIEPTGAVAQVEEGIFTSNGQGFSPDNRTYYYTDTSRRAVYAYDFDKESGAIANRRVHVSTDGEVGRPDGLTVDSEGCLWIAMWEGFALLRYDPGGKKIEEIPMPVAKPTSCAFGGESLTELYVTSARVGLDQIHLDAYPLSGSLFVIETDTKGKEEHRFRG